jgi:hypothetical protein
VGDGGKDVKMVMVKRGRSGGGSEDVKVVMGRLGLGP